jgi:hypothetical protein
MEGQPINGTLAETYLSGRGIPLTAFDFDLTCLRYHFHVRHPRDYKVEGGTRWNFPTLIAAIEYCEPPEFDFAARYSTGYQYTFLDQEGRKLAHPVLDARLTEKGSWIAGAGVWFGTPRRGELFVVGEGIETVLSAMILFDGRAGVATLGARWIYRAPSCPRKPTRSLSPPTPT